MKKVFSVVLLCAFALFVQLQVREAKAATWVQQAEVYTFVSNTDPTFSKTTLGESGHLMVGATTTNATDAAQISYSVQHSWQYQNDDGTLSTNIASLTVGLTLAYYIQTYNTGTGGVGASPDQIFYSAPNYTAPYDGEAISLGSHTFITNLGSVVNNCQLTASANGSAARSNAQIYFYGSGN